LRRRNGFDLYILRDEFIAHLDNVIDKEGYYFLLEHMPRRSQVMGRRDLAVALQDPTCYDLFVWNRPFDVSSLDSYTTNSVSLGMLTLWLPETEGNCLERAFVAFTYDPELEEYIPSAEASQRLFDKLDRYFRSVLHRPLYDHLGRTVQRSYYSDGALDWVRNGGVLSQSCSSGFYYTTEKP
jgi:hypothetical protein